MEENAVQNDEKKNRLGPKLVAKRLRGAAAALNRMMETARSMGGTVELLTDVNPNTGFQEIHVKSCKFEL